MRPEPFPLYSQSLFTSWFANLRSTMKYVNSLQDLVWLASAVKF